MATYYGAVLAGSLQIGQVYGSAVIPNPWEAYFTISGFVQTGDGANIYIISGTHNQSWIPIRVFWTEDSLNRVSFDVVPTALNISGYIEDGVGSDLGGVIVATNGDSDETNVIGNYSIAGINAPFTGIITPIKEGYIFTPESYSFTNIYYHKTGKDFVGSPAPPGKAQNPTPTDAEEDIALGLIKLQWDAPA